MTKVIKSQVGYVQTEHFVIDLTDEEPVLVNFVQQADDVMISLDGGDVVISWDRENWDDTQCLLVKEHDNLKEISNLKCTSLIMKLYRLNPASEKIRVFLTIERN